MLRTLAILLALGSPLFAQAPARGLAVKVEFALEPTEITLGDEATLTLTIRNTFNPQQLTRPDLRKLDAFARRFQITDLPGDPPKANAPAVKFVYRLRPRESGTIEVPRFAFMYLTPRDQPNTTLTQKGLAIEVKAPVVSPPVIVPLDGPEVLFMLPRLEEFREPTPVIWTLGSLVVAVVCGPLVGLTGYVLWRRAYPDAATLMKLRRRRAARRALRAMDTADRSDDPAGRLAAAIRGYLHDRGLLIAEATTTEEVAAALESRGELPSRETIAFLQRCDAVRFSLSKDGSLAADARSLLVAWEQG